MALDWFGFDDPAVPRRLTAPAGLEAVHQDGYSWARQGTRKEDTSWISPDQWNRLVAQMRGLLNDPAIDVSDLAQNAPTLLRVFIARKIVAILANLDVPSYGLMPKADYDPDDDGIIGLAQGGTGVAATDNADLRDKLGISTAIDALSTSIAAALLLKAPLASPAFTGNPTAPTQAARNRSTRLATTAYVDDAIDVAVKPGTVLISFDATPQSGFVELDGATISGGAASYPVVAARYPWMVSSGNIVLPDMRGRFLRSWAHGSANDPDRATRTARAGDGQTGDYPGTNQAHAFQNHQHRPTNRASSVGAETGDGYQNGAPDSDSLTSGAVTGNTSTETRPININVMYQMRLG